MTDIIFDTEFPKEVRPAFEAVLMRHINIVPDWCYTLRIWSSTGGGEGAYSLSSKTLHEYRRASIYVYSGWINSIEETREQNVIHELFHIVLAPAHEHALAQLKRVLSTADVNLREGILDTFRDQCEIVCEDLSRLYWTNRLKRSEA